MFTLNARLLHTLQSALLFVLLWSRMAGELSFTAGAVLYAVLVSVLLLMHKGLSLMKLKSRRADFLPSAVMLLFLLAVRLMIPVSALLPAPGNLFLLRFYLYLLPILPFAVLLSCLSDLALRFRPAHAAALAFYLMAAVLLMSRKGWGLVLPGGSLVLAGAFLFIFLILELLLILSAGRRNGRISLFPGLFILCLLPLLVLLPLNRLYEKESRTEGGGLLESSLFRFDFSDFLSLESSISMKQDLVFLMRLEGPEEDWRVRRFILSAYDEKRGFHRDKESYPEAPGLRVETPLVGEYPRRWEDGPEYEGRENLEQEYYLVNFDAGAFLGLNSPFSVTPYENWDSSSFSRIYAVESEVSRIWGWELMDDEGITLGAESGVDTEEDAEFLEYYSRWNGDAALRDLAEEITEGSYGYYARVKALEEFLQNEYYYTLEPGTAADGNQLNYFLFDAKKGYCSYFAFAMTMLCRSLGIPARVALGFWVSGNGEVLNFYPVRADQAHAWVEVYFPRFGWVEFDPTSTTPAPGEEYPFSPPPPEELEGYLKEILENRDSLEIQNNPDPENITREEGDSDALGRRRVLYPLAGLTVLLFCVSFARVRFLLRIPRRKSCAARFFHLHLALTGFPPGVRQSGEKMRAYIREENLEELKTMLGVYERIRFSRSSLSDLRLLDESGRALRIRLFREQGLWGRILYMKRLVLYRRSR